MRHDDFDRAAQKTAWLALFVMLVAASVNFVVLGFVGWVVVKLLQHFGVI